MNNKYVIYMKNGRIITVSKQKYETLSDVLKRPSPPAFVDIDGNLLSVQAISYCAIERDEAW